MLQNYYFFLKIYTTSSPLFDEKSTKVGSRRNPSIKKTGEGRKEVTKSPERSQKSTLYPLTF